MIILAWPFRDESTRLALQARKGVEMWIPIGFAAVVAAVSFKDGYGARKRGKSLLWSVGNGLAVPVCVVLLISGIVAVVTF
ncbi:MAG: hypothetical protein WC734_03065 [Patescibacteria group bacterium]|jgi:hypothetical protein